MHPHLCADFQNVDPDGHIRMNTSGTLEDLARLRLLLSEGLAAELCTDDCDSNRGLSIPATIEFNPSEEIWAAVVDWSQLTRVVPEATPEFALPLLCR